MDSNATSPDTSSCYQKIDAFLWGLPAGLVLAALLLLCFNLFGNAITNRRNRNVASASSNTQIDRKYILGRKKKRGPQPSSELRPVNVNQMALQEGAPDDIKAMAGKLAKASEQGVLKSNQ